MWFTVRHSALLLTLCLATQLTLLGSSTTQRVRHHYRQRTVRTEGISQLVDRIADSEYGLIDPIPEGSPTPGATPSQPVTPEEPWMKPEWTVPPPPNVDQLVVPEEIHRLIELEARRHNIDPLLVEAVVRNESGYNPWSVSPTGALGLMQLMPDTATLVGVSDPFDPAQNIAGGVLYLSWQLRDFGGDVALAVAAYNAGPAAVQRWGGIPPYQETSEYVRRVVEDYRRLVQQKAVAPSLGPPIENGQN